MKEVSGRIVAVYAQLAAENHREIGALLADLPLDPSNIRDRFDFDAVMVFLDRLMDAFGGPEALEEAFVRFEPSSPEIVALAHRFDTPLALATFVNTTMGAANYSCVHLTMRSLSSTRYELRSQVDVGYHGSLAFVHATVGFLRGLPRLLRLAEAQVTWSGTPDDFLCRVTLPTQPTLGPRVEPLVAEARARAGTYLAALLADRAHYQRDADRVGRALSRIGRAAETAPSSRAYAEVVVRAFRDDLGHAFCLVADERGDTLASDGEPSAPELTLALLSNGERIGQIRTDPADGRDTLQPLLPLLALGLRERLRRESVQRSLAAQESFPSEWGLTKRQREVAELIVQGRSNPSIAAALGCAIGTVEDHLTAIYEKAGVDGRQLLMARTAAFRRG